MSRVARILLLSLMTACHTVEVWRGQDLATYPNPVSPGDARYQPQPHRDKPRELAVDGSGTIWVSLQGTRDHPGHQVAWIDGETGTVGRLDTLGSSPTGLAMHPDGRWLVVFNRFSDFATVVDTVSREVADTLTVDFYSQEGLFGDDGEELWFTNRWRDSVEMLRLEDTGSRLTVVGRSPGIPVVNNPRDLVMSPDGRWLAVGSPTSLAVSLVDVAAHQLHQTLDVGAPVNGLAFVDDLLLVATTSAGTGHHADRDGTANVSFSDVQNELALYRVPTGDLIRRYTSDSACCVESADVAPDNPASDGLIAGALPQQVTTLRRDGVDWAWVSYSASNQLQRFSVDASTGTLTDGGTWSTGHEPHGLVATDTQLVVAHRLGETVGTHDLDGAGPLHTYDVGDFSGGSYPATDAELGELVVNVTAPLTTDGDQSCAHCHPRGSNIGRSIALNSALYPTESHRMTMPFAGLADTAPWFWEGMIDETDFVPVGLARPADLSDEALIARSLALTGRTSSFAGSPLNFDGLSEAMAAFLVAETHLLPNPNSSKTEAVARGEALFERLDVGCATCHPGPTFAASMSNNPFGVPLKMGPVVSARRVDGVNVDLLNDGFVASFPRSVQTRCVDVCAPEVCAADPAACDDLRVVGLAVPSLRGLWDRAPGFLHDGRAKNLREVLCVPGHPALEPGEVGFNVRDGVVDSHGGTSHLDARSIADLAAYLLTL